MSNKATLKDGGEFTIVNETTVDGVRRVTDINQHVFEIGADGYAVRIDGELDDSPAYDDPNALTVGEVAATDSSIPSEDTSDEAGVSGELFDGEDGASGELSDGEDETGDPVGPPPLDLWTPPEAHYDDAA